jgi:methylated-DNA-[protein]-cysteine S-methyltransferase
VWSETVDGPKVVHIYLPGEGGEVYGPPTDWPHATLRSCPEIDELAAQMQRYLDGDPAEFSLDLLALGRRTYFQRRVLLAEYAIPRGRVSTYGRVARAVGIPGAARAVGQALARNPFPIIIPCHRAVRSDGSLGGYRGGVAMKRALLRLEGVAVNASDRVVVDQFYY